MVSAFEELLHFFKQIFGLRFEAFTINIRDLSSVILCVSAVTSLLYNIKWYISVFFTP